MRLTICLVIANLALPGLEDFVLVAQQQDPSVKVIAIRVSGTGSTPTVKVDGAHSRSQSDWLATVRHVLGNEKENGAG